MSHTRESEFYDYYIHRPSNQPVHEWWYSQKQDWFSHCTMNHDDFHIQIVTPREIPLDTIHENWVIWWDQIMRHPFHPSSDSTVPTNTTRTEMYPLILELARHLVPIVSREEAKIFMLLAIRHDNAVKSKQFVVDYMREWIGSMLDQNKTPSSLLYRFFHASLKDLMKLNHDVIDIALSTQEIESQTYMERTSQITRLSTKYSILETDHETDKLSPHVYNDDLVSTVYQIMNKLDPPSICVSLSGGVDSMVLATCVAYWAKLQKRSCCFLHIQYNNRATCREEVDFLRDWTMLNFNVPLFVRNITELTRRRTTEWRNIYESITREYRFQAYQLLGGHVVLGHNFEDTIENMLTNLSNGTHWKNLKGMTEHSEEQGVQVYRPFLKISKEQLIGFAHTYNIPYLEDSTPSWSRRGQLRDNVIPALKAFDSRLLAGLSTMADKLEEQHKTYLGNTNIWLDAKEMPIDYSFISVRTKTMNKKSYPMNTGWRIPYEDCVLRMEFWDVFFQRHSLICSQKSKTRWIETLNNSGHYEFCPLSKTVNAYKDKDYIYVFTVG